MDTLGDRLKYARKKNGYTQDSLGRTIGVSRGVIYNLEKNITEPQAIVLNAICQTLKVNLSWLTEGVGNMEESCGMPQGITILHELYDTAKGLSENEQLFLLDTIRSLKHRFGEQE